MRKIILSLFAMALLISCSSKANMKNVPDGFIPRTVVIDPGHGGKFSGMDYSARKITGYKDVKVYKTKMVDGEEVEDPVTEQIVRNGKKEKIIVTKKVPKYKTIKIFKEQDIALSISQELRKLLEKDPRFKAIMTRETDKELGSTLAEDLSARVKIAEYNNADLFVSIHVNASSGSGRDTCKQQGFEIIYRSTGKDDKGRLDTPRGSTEEEKKQDVERQENAKKEGIALAAKVSSQMRKKGLTQNRDPYSDYVTGKMNLVLRKSRWPAIIVETGYICNEKDRKIMTEEPVKIAEGIYNGIVEYGKQSGWFE